MGLELITSLVALCYAATALIYNVHEFGKFGNEFRKISGEFRKIGVEFRKIGRHLDMLAQDAKNLGKIWQPNRQPNTGDHGRAPGHLRVEFR